jgi:zinc D-Ala-D-Ala carboxypeptidase
MSGRLPYVDCPDRPLTPHFRLYEFLRSATAAREQIDNTPWSTEERNLEAVARYLEAERALLAAHYGCGVQIHITSGFRSEDLNAAVGGSETSDHAEGLAVDRWHERMDDRTVIDPRDVIGLLEASDLPFDQLIYYPGEPRIHSGYGKPHRREIRHKAGGHYPLGLPA